MRVAILVKEFPPNVVGGTETQTLRLARELHRRTDHEVTVYTKSYPHSDLDDIPFELVRVPNWRASPFLSTLTFVFASLVLLLRDRHRIDLLQCMMIYPNGFIGYLINKLTGTPYFAWIRGGDYYFMKANPVKRTMIDIVLRDTLVLTQTEAVRDDVLAEFPAATIDVLGNGVSLPAERAVGDAVVFVGRLKRQKGVHVLLQAMENIDAPLLIVGDGPERDALEQTATELGVDAEFVGEIPPSRVTDYLLDGSIFVLPSVDGEGLPNVILEAMSVGLPVIGTDTGGVRNVIDHGRTGYVVDPGDTDSLEEKIRCLLDNPGKRDQMSTAAREHVAERYSWPAIISELERIYQERTSRPAD